MASQRQLSSFHEISTDRQTWSAAHTVPELFPRTAAPPVGGTAPASNGVSSTDEDNGLISLQDAADEPSSQRYLYSRDGETYGPVSVQRLAQLVALGQLGPSDFVSRGGGSAFLPACELPELADSFRTGVVASPELNRMQGLPPARQYREETNPAAKLSGEEIALAIVLPGVACILAIVWIAQGNPKGQRALGLSLACCLSWAVIFLFVMFVIPLFALSVIRP